MKAKAKQKRLQRKISDFLTDRAVQKAILDHPGSYHCPGSVNKT